MNTIGTWLATSPYGTWAKSFLAVLITIAVGDWATDGIISLANWQAWVLGAIVATAPVLVNLINPADTRYGRGSASKE